MTLWLYICKPGVSNLKKKNEKKTVNLRTFQTNTTSAPSLLILQCKSLHLFQLSECISEMCVEQFIDLRGSLNIIHWCNNFSKIPMFIFHQFLIFPRTASHRIGVRAYALWIAEGEGRVYTGFKCRELFRTIPRQMLFTSGVWLTFQV